MEKKKILIAEDDKNIADLMKISLEPFGYDILLTRNGEDACMAFVNESPDLILLDILMPKMNGFQVCEWIRKRPYRNQTPIIMISGVYRKQEQQEEAITKYGANEFIIKPFRMDFLLDKIKHFLDRDKEQEEDEDILLESEISSVSYVGKLSENPIETLLHLLFIKRESGKLVLRKDKLRIHLYFRNGNLIFVQTNIKKFTLAHYFYSAGKLMREQLDTIELKVRREKLSREEVINRLGYLSDDEILIGLNLMFQDIVYLAFRWDSGDYYFLCHREPPQASSWHLTQSTANLILGGIRRSSDLPRITARLPQSHQVLTKSQNPLTRYQNISLKSEEQEVLDLVDGVRSFSIVENLASLITNRARFILYGLLVTGIIEVRFAAAGEEDDLILEEEGEAEGILTGATFKIENTGGNLLIEPLPGLLFNCHRSRFNGEISFENNDLQKIVKFKNGMIIFASSNVPTERLGEVLLSLGKLDARRFAKAIRLQTKEPAKKIGTILLDLGYITEDHLQLALQLQVKRIVLDIFTWGRGSYKLTNMPIIEDEEITIALKTPAIIMESIRSIQQDNALKRFLPRDDLSLKLVDDFDEISDGFDFTEGERQIIRQVDGQKSLRELLSIFGIGRHNIFGFFYGLSAMKLIEVIHGRPREAAPERVSVDASSWDTVEEISIELENETMSARPVIEEPPLTLETLTGSSSQVASSFVPQPSSHEKVDERVALQDMVDDYYKIVQTGDFYRILNVDRKAELAEIKMSFRKLAKQFHPDSVYKTGARYTLDVLNEIFLKINEAYQTLSNPSMREQYNRETPERRVGETDEDVKLRADLVYQEGLSLLRAQKPLDATDRFREAIRLYSGKSLYHCRLVEAYLEAKVPPRRIIRNALDAVKLDPDLADTHYILGRVYFELQDVNHAREELEKAISLNASFHQAQELLDRLTNQSR